MKVYIVQERGKEYDDEYWSRKEGGTPIKAYRSPENAEEARERLEKELNEGGNIFEGHDGPLENNYEVVEVEVADDDLDGYEAERDRAREAGEKAEGLLKEALLNGASKIFDAYPQLESFGWRQYTDYFNDGEALCFRLRCEEPDLNGECSYDLEGEWVDGAAGAVCGLIESFDRRHLRGVFDDHVRVIVKRDLTIEVDEYTDHG